MKEFRGRTAFITGAASGIGFGIAQALAAQNVRLVITDIDQEALNLAAANLSEAKAEILALKLDVADRSAWEEAAAMTERRFGSVSILCNNAGVSVPGGDVDMVDQALWDRCVEINLTGVFNGCATFVPRMRSAGLGGHVVNTSSLSGLIVVPGMNVYTATKFAVVALSESLRDEVAPAGIGVSVLCPAAVRSRLWRTSRKAQGLPDIATPPAQSLASGSAAPHALDPAWVGRLVVKAMRDDQLYIITHPEHRGDVQARCARMGEGFDWAERTIAEGVLGNAI